MRGLYPSTLQSLASLRHQDKASAEVSEAAEERSETRREKEARSPESQEGSSISQEMSSHRSIYYLTYHHYDDILSYLRIY